MIRRCVKWVMVGVLAGLLVIGLNGCGTARAGFRPRPEWIAQPKTDDSVYLYRVGHAQGQVSREAARDAACQDAFQQVVKVFDSYIPGRRASVPLTNAVAIRNVEILPGGLHTERNGDSYEGWVQVSYPLAEKQKIIERIERGDKLSRMWAEAQTELQQHRYDKAEKIIREVFAQKDQALYVDIDVNEARLVMGDIYREQNNVIDARLWYEGVLNSTEDSQWKKTAAEKTRLLPDPPRFWPMQSRWNGRKVALLCVLRAGQGCRRFLDLTNIMTRECNDARLVSVDIAAALDAAGQAVFFDAMDFAAARKAAEAQQAGLIFGVLFDVDPAKRGKMASNFGVDVPVPDAVVRFFLVRVADGKLIYNSQFKEIAGARPEANLADHSAAVIITKHLIPQCPAVTEQ